MKTFQHIRLLFAAIAAATAVHAQVVYQFDFEGSLDSGFESPVNGNYTSGFTSSSPEVTSGTQAYQATALNQASGYITILRITNTGTSQAFKNAFQEGNVITFDTVYTGLDGANYLNLQFTRADSSAVPDFLVLADSAYNNRGNVHSVSYTITATQANLFANSAEYKLEFHVNNGANGTNSGTASIDNLRITGTAIPEPSAFAALAGVAVLGLAAQRRRRR